jgi:hypothetical protein
MSPHQHADTTAAYLDSLLMCVGQLSLILDHMARHENSEADAPIDETLRRLLADVLDHQAELPASDLDTATAVLTATSQGDRGRDLPRRLPTQPATSVREALTQRAPRARATAEALIPRRDHPPAPPTTNPAPGF